MIQQEISCLLCLQSSKPHLIDPEISSNTSDDATWQKQFAAKVHCVDDEININLKPNGYDGVGFTVSIQLENGKPVIQVFNDDPEIADPLALMELNTDTYRLVRFDGNMNVQDDHTYSRSSAQQTSFEEFCRTTAAEHAAESRVTAVDDESMAEAAISRQPRL